MCDFFDFNKDGKVDAFEFFLTSALDPNNPLNQDSEQDEDETADTSHILENKTAADKDDTEDYND